MRARGIAWADTGAGAIQGRSCKHREEKACGRRCINRRATGVQQTTRQANVGFETRFLRDQRQRGCHGLALPALTWSGESDVGVRCILLKADVNRSCGSAMVPGDDVV